MVLSVGVLTSHLNKVSLVFSLLACLQFANDKTVKAVKNQNSTKVFQNSLNKILSGDKPDH